MKRLIAWSLCCIALSGCVEGLELTGISGNGEPEAQQGLKLCWAATTEYIMRYYAMPAHGGLQHKFQCELAYDGYWERNVRPTDGTMVPECTNVGMNVPPLYRDFQRYPFHGANSGLSAMDYGYAYDFTGIGSSHASPHLTFDEIRDEVLHHGPFIMAVNYIGGSRGLHFMVGSGYFWDGDRKFVKYWNTMPTSIYEMGPPTPAKHWAVSYSAYSGESSNFTIEVDGSTSTPVVTHAFDLYHFRPIITTH
jgi:hypothetical protein